MTQEYRKGEDTNIDKPRAGLAAATLMKGHRDPEAYTNVGREEDFEVWRIACEKGCEATLLLGCDIPLTRMIETL